ncbi:MULTISPECIES: restriction endonuclease PLD domain-containing protein [unclassified Gemella]|uniref:restriction endonuclease PLD domain-containing protein n=1 Tax=unclassified Gemella TaxID=2624949 RepID=UPI001C052592|nr:MULTISPECIES: restriction endonuclease PLD domain-containing protein [unclassified Gemella]MBU0279035.1 restriction endonuclease [Gemella sp. zg-1178]QWQ39106.1 restriction endonuclease [Gemella sp. zg-570]
MESKFFLKQDDYSKKLYVELLEVTCSLSNLFSESKSPFLYYRAMENIFCKSFNADNLSRSDVSADAGKNGIGIGLKTFLQNKGNTFQKIAEFNKESYLLRDLKGLDLVKKVSEMRNERIKSTMRICNLNEMMYHLVTRSDKYIYIFEEDMDLINIDNIKVTSQSKTTIHFTDMIHEYSFSLSKSTLLKRFNTCRNNKIFGFSVEILKDPYNFLLSIKNKDIIEENSVDKLYLSDNSVIDYIVLPLYSTRNNRVEERSGLNQWNARGRIRNLNEVYISIPSWIHKNKKQFFNYSTEDNKTTPFDVKLPNGKIISMRVAQQGGKALMSNPNSELGKWILRDILELKEGELVTREKLDIMGIDSIKLSKMKNGIYNLDFLKLGSFEEFEEEFRK